MFRDVSAILVSDSAFLAATLQPAALIKVRHRNVTGGYCGLAYECAAALLLHTGCTVQL